MRFTSLTIFAAAFVTTFSCAWIINAQANPVSLPDIGDPSAAVLSPAQEQALGEALMRNIRARSNVLDDPEINEYVESIGFRLVAQSNRPSQAFGFFVVQNPSINAFALPGGYIGINSGLITTARSESELAAVMAHEIAHVTQRHLSRGYEAVDRLSIPTAAAIIASILLGVQDPALGQAALIAVIGGSAQYQLSFTRTHENEADWIGINNLAQAGFDPGAMASFFGKLQDNTRLQGAQAPEFLSSHPVTLNRISDARSRAEKFAARPYSDSLSFHLARAKINVIDEPDSNKLLARLTEQIKSKQYRSESAAKYELALVTSKHGDIAGARKLINQLLKQDPNRIAYQLAAAQIEESNRNSATALDIYRKALALNPNNYSITMAYSKALINANEGETARRLLRQFVLRRPKDAPIFELLAKAEEQQHHDVESHQHYAEFYFLSGQTGEAIAQLETALSSKRADNYQKSAIEARMAELKEIAESEARRR